MEFELTGELEMLQQTLRRFVTEVVAPNARAWDRDQALPQEAITELAEMGMLGIMVPADHDGAELGVLEMAVVTEELARGDGALALAVANHNALCCAHVAAAASPEQKNQWLGPLARGERLGAWAGPRACPEPGLERRPVWRTEPGAGFPSRARGAQKTTPQAYWNIPRRRFRAPRAQQGSRFLATGAKPIGALGVCAEPGRESEVGIHAARDGQAWRLSGVDPFVPLGSAADLFVVLATTKPDDSEQIPSAELGTGHSAGLRTGLTAFVIERGRQGFSPQPLRDILGVRAAGAARLVLDKCAVPDTDRLGEIGSGTQNAQVVIDVAHLLTAAMAVGLGIGALQASRQYAKDRQQFGQAISTFQAIQWKLADMATELSAARLLTHRAAWLHDSGRPFAEAAAMAKLFAAQAAMSATDQAIQIHGGFGYTAEFPPERLYRDARLCSIDKGSDDSQRLVIAKQLLAKV